MLSPHADGISNSSSVHSLCAGRHFDLFGENYRKVPSNVRRLKLRLVIVLLSYFSCAKRRGDLLILFWSLHPPTHTFLHLPHHPPPTHLPTHPYVEFLRSWCIIYIPLSVPRAMEEGRIQEAETEKNRLENMQRERRKKAESMGHEQSPLWFR